MKNFLTFDASNTVEIITIAAVCLLVVIVLLLSFFGKRKFDTNAVATGAICIALSFALSFIKISLPYGGSITFASMVPLIVYALCFGWVNGLLTGIIYGLLQFIQSPFFLTPAQFLLDFILAFAVIAVCGLFKNSKSKWSIIAATGIFFASRLLMHFLAGFIFYSTADFKVSELPIFGSTAQMGAAVYSMLYNLIYMVPECAISITVVAILKFKSSSFNNMMLKFKR